MSQKKTSFIYIVADDLGYADLGCYDGRDAPFGPLSPVLDAAGVAAAPERPLDGRTMLPVLRDASQQFEHKLYWRMNYRDQRALRHGDWKYLKVDDHEYLFNIPADERERANRAPLEPQRLAAMRADWLAWNESMPPIPPDATVSLGYSAKDMPQR